MELQIVGNGIPALLSALSACNAGAQVCLIENSAATADQRVIELNPAACRLLRAMRLFEPIAARASNPRWMHHRTLVRGFLLSWLALADVFPARYGAPMLYIGTRQMERVLRLHLQRYPVRYLSKPSPDLPTVETAAPAEDDGNRWVRWSGLTSATVVRRATRTLAATWWSAPGQSLFYAPVARDRVIAWSAVIPSGVELQEAFSEAHPTVAELIDRGSSQRQPARTASPSAANLTVGQHPPVTPEPRMDLGASLAVEEAWALGQCLEDYDDDFDAGAVHFERFRTPRRGQIEHRIRSSETDGEDIPPWRQWVRNGAVAARARLLPEMELERLDWLYGYDPIRHYESFG